jgi:hypothetical protein
LSRGAALVITAAAALAALAPGAHADVVKLPKTRAVLDVPSGWTPIDGATERGLVAGYRGDRGMLLAVTRAPVPNERAYRKDVRDTYVDEIERGIAASVQGYRRVARRFATPNGTATLDLEARRADGATIVVRVLMFWTYALSLAIEVPPGADAKIARDIAAKFAPPGKPAATPGKPAARPRKPAAAPAAAGS